MISVDQEMAPVLVYLQWQLQTVIPMALLIGTHMMLLRSSVFTRFSPWVALAISGIFAATLFVPLALAIDFWLEPLTQQANYVSELLDEWISVMPPVTICWIALNTPWILGYRLEKISTPELQADPSVSYSALEPDFMALLPPEKRGKILFLKSELHYLQVVTNQGSGLILYNLSDAIAQLPVESGLAVHRSYWVAIDAIDELSRSGRQGKLTIRNGQTIPVSRNKLKAVSKTLELR